MKIRLETIQNLGLDKNRALHLRLTDATTKFCECSFSDALATIFNLLYEADADIKEKFLQNFKFTLSSEKSFDSDDCYFVTEEMAKTIAQELQFQYMAAHPSFMKIKDFPGCETELDSLKKSLEQHPLLLFRAVESVRNYYTFERFVSENVPLLLSEKSSCQFQGLYKLGHNHKYQNLLLPYVKEIGELLKALHSNHINHQRILAAQEELDTFTSPFASLSGLLEQKQAEIAEAEPASIESVAEPVSAELPFEVKIEQSESSVPDGLSMFINNKESLTFNIPGFDEFWKCMKMLRQIGIDLNVLTDYLPEIWEVLNAHENLENAEANLLKAEQEHATAKESYLKSCRAFEEAYKKS